MLGCRYLALPLAGQNLRRAIRVGERYHVRAMLVAALKCELEQRYCAVLRWGVAGCWLHLALPRKRVKPGGTICVKICRHCWAFLCGWTFIWAML
jgi:hypothetical protein